MPLARQRRPPGLRVRLAAASSADRRRRLERPGEPGLELCLLGRAQARVRMERRVEPRRHRAAADGVNDVARAGVLRAFPLAEVQCRAAAVDVVVREPRERRDVRVPLPASSRSNGSRSMPAWRAAACAASPTSVPPGRAGSYGCGRTGPPGRVRTARQRRSESGRPNGAPFDLGLRAARQHRPAAARPARGTTEAARQKIQAQW